MQFLVLCVIMLLELHSKKRKYSYIDCPKRMRAELSRSVGLPALEPTPDVVTRSKMQGL